MECCKCKNEATYDSPEDYCAYHWAKWWTQDYETLLSKEEYEKEFAEVLKIAMSL